MDDILATAGSWDHCYPGNLNIEKTWEAMIAEITRLRVDRDAARGALERDRSVVIDAANKFGDAYVRRCWLLDGRGSFEWDDDRYRDEFRGAYEEMAAPVEVLRKIGSDWTNCPTNHEEIAAARVDWQARAEKAEASLGACVIRERQYADRYWENRWRDEAKAPHDAAIEMIGKLLDAKVTAYAQEHGSYDFSTGATEFTSAGEDYVSTIEELAEEIRALKEPQA